MPQPSSALSTLRPDLTASLMEFDLAMGRQGFIASRALPVIEVASQAGKFGKIPLEQLLQTRSTTRAPGAPYSRADFTFQPASYTCEEHGFEAPVDDREAEMYREYFDAELIATQRAFDAVLRNAEIRAATLLFNATTFASQLTTVVNEWDDIANATPITDVDTAVKAVWGRTGVWPNALLLNKKVFKNLRRCTQVVDAIESSGAGFPARQRDINEAMLAAVFDLDQVIVAGSPKNTANEGQSVSISPIWSDEYAMVTRVATTDDPSEPCIGRTFHWAEDGSTYGGTVETYRDESVRGEIVRVRHDVDELILYTEIAQLLDNITT